MINIEHIRGFRGCNSCGEWTNREIYFKINNKSNMSVCVSLCDECLKLLGERMVWERMRMVRERMNIYKKEIEEEKCNE